MARFITLTGTTASVTSGGGTLGLDLAITGGASFVRIVKIKVSFSAGTGNSTLELFTKDTKLAADRVYIAKDFNTTLHDIADTSSGTAAETKAGATFVDYEDEDLSGELHWKFTNNDSVNKTYTYTVLVEECPAFDSSRIMSVQKAELLGDILYFGGRTSSHAMWKRASTYIQSRLGDDSGFAGVTANGFLSDAGVVWLGGQSAAEVSLVRAGTELRVRLGDNSAYAAVEALTFNTSNSIVYIGGTTASEVSLRRSGTQLRIRTGDDSAFADGIAETFTANNYVQTTGAIIFMGGSTSSHVSLRRSTTNLLVKLGDDSAFASIFALNVLSTAGIYHFTNSPSSSFPMLKRSSTTVQVRLADDSGDADIQGRNVLFTGSSGIGLVGQTSNDVLMKKNGNFTLNVRKGDDSADGNILAENITANAALTQNGATFTPFTLDYKDHAGDNQSVSVWSVT